MYQIIHSMINRCQWVTNELLAAYHDNEWCRPEHDDKKIFEFLILEGAQAGLSWLTILKRREGYRKAFLDFCPNTVAEFDNHDISELMLNSSIIRNKLKILSAINNAQKFLKIQKEFGSFDNYIWKFTNYIPITNNFKKLSDLPSSNNISSIMSQDLKKHGFTFVGPTICYSFMQAIGMVNDHVTQCFLYKNQS